MMADYAFMLFVIVSEVTVITVHSECSIEACVFPFIRNCSFIDHDMLSNCVNTMKASLDCDPRLVMYVQGFWHITQIQIDCPELPVPLDCNIKWCFEAAFFDVANLLDCRKLEKTRECVTKELYVPGCSSLKKEIKNSAVFLEIISASIACSGTHVMVSLGLSLGLTGVIYILTPFRNILG